MKIQFNAPFKIGHRGNAVVRFCRILTRHIKRFGRWVSKSFGYSCMLWRDTDYDWSSILKILQYKLKRTREHITDHNIIIDAQDIGKEIRTVELLIDRIIADEYCNKEFEDHRTKWDDPTKNFIDNLNRNRTEEERKEFEHISDKYNQLRRADFDLLFDTMKLKIETWWD